MGFFNVRKPNNQQANIQSAQQSAHHYETKHSKASLPISTAVQRIPLNPSLESHTQTMQISSEERNQKLTTTAPDARPIATDEAHTSMCEH